LKTRLFFLLLYVVFRIIAHFLLLIAILEKYFKHVMLPSAHNVELRGGALLRRPARTPGYVIFSSFALPKKPKSK
jgi:hypothetical protein